MSFPTNGTLVSTAHQQWAKRPADERFASVPDLCQALNARRQGSKEVIRPFAGLSAVANGEQVNLRTEKGEAALTHWAFTQLCSAAGLSSRMLRQSFEQFQSTAQAAAWVADGLNLGLKGRGPSENKDANILLSMVDGKPVIRSLMTESYARVWDADLAKNLLLPLLEQGFINPPAYDGPGGLYAGDSDLFALMVPQNVTRINMPTYNGPGPEKFQVPGVEGEFSPFLMFANSEVGKSSAWFARGLVHSVCANLNLWGVEGMTETRVIHKGNPWRKIWQEYNAFVWTYCTYNPKGDIALIQKATEFLVGKTPEDAVKFVSSKTELSQKLAREAVATIEKGDRSTGIISQDPTVLWNLVAAITANARSLGNQDTRVDTCQQAGKLMAFAR